MEDFNKLYIPNIEPDETKLDRLLKLKKSLMVQQPEVNMPSMSENV